MKYPKKIQTISTWLNYLRLPVKVTFILMGVVSTAWFLIRVIPKPSRAAYPCMRAAAPVMSGFVVYLLGLSISALIFKKLRDYIRKARFITAGIMLIAGLVTLGFMVVRNPLKVRADVHVPLAIHTPNEPMGEANGIFPGRVVWAWNPDATNENCVPTTYGDGWWMAKNNNQTIVDQMMHGAILKLTGESTVASAWDTLFRFHNNKKHGTNNPYTPGEKILIKINVTSAWSVGNLSWEMMSTNFEKNNNSYYGIAETSPQVVLSVLRQMVNDAGVSQIDIYVGDPMKNIYKHAYDMWYAEFPNVHYLGNNIHYNNFSLDDLINNGRTPVVEGSDVLLFYSDINTIPEIDLTYTIVEEADYMINIPALKAHARAGITLTAKNHFGTQSRGNANHLHPGLVAPNEGTPTRTSYGMYRTQVDLMGHPYLGGNTMLFIVDGLWAGSEAVDPPTKWDMAPFNGDWTSSVFMSQDQVALESVCFDFLRSEYDGTGSKVNYPNYEGVDDYLRQAADPSKWPAGITYMPDGEHPLTSLGIHEHWNNSISKQYSRNLGLNEGIQLLSIPEGLVLSSENHEVITGLLEGIINAYPNPFSEDMTIEYQVKGFSTIEIDVVNIYGQEVKNLLKETQSSGSYSLIWDGTGENSGLLPSGIYFVRLKSYTNKGLQTDTKQIQILR
jgi:hypothetical protein